MSDLDSYSSSIGTVSLERKFFLYQVHVVTHISFRLLDVSCYKVKGWRFIRFQSAQLHYREMKARMMADERELRRPSLR